jgi:hypothetical protein
VEEAKAFAKAIKANNAEILMHLWNNCVNVPYLTKGRKDNALDAI